VWALPMTTLRHFRNQILLPAMLSVSLAAQGTESFMVVEAHSGKILVAANSSVKRPVASLTKLATAAVAVDWATATNTDPGKLVITMPETISLVGGPNPLNLQPGDRMTLRDALNSALLGSDNLAALAIADHVGRAILSSRGRRGEPVVAFVAEMNKLAKALEMRHTRFVNPHGLERPGAQGLSTAADMARLSIYAMRKPAITFIVRQNSRQVSVTGPAGTRGFRVPNTNELVGESGVIGIKTGTTQAAGPCLATCSDREPLVRTKPDGSKGATPRRLIVVVLNSPDRFNRTRGLMRKGWSVYDAWLAAGAPVQDARREILKVPDPQ
jgi:serine-type D-Ala-D-Ala carboxypeptidase (penicillin-binding protein 5/6)